jgi:hypothetical protein
MIKMLGKWLILSGGFFGIMYGILQLMNFITTFTI